MPECIIVVSDPRIKNPRVIPVKVVGLENLEYNEKHKEQRILPNIHINPEVLKIINPPLGVVVVRIWKNRANNEKVKLVGKAVVDNSLDVLTVGVPLTFLTEKIGSSQVIGEVFAASAFQVRISEDVASKLIGMRIGDRIDGRLIGLPNVTLEIRGGSDLAGFPMRPDVEGPVKKYLLLSSGPGFKPKEKGERRRKLVRGDTISPDIVQINTVIVST
ncbi:MAG: 30S ribosomal protein S6e [Desulfurococcaceae archaeon]|jgi:small subunit ribosomal protein S6e|nr:30S ribosomal protein S6e [Desulfurococcaceae archaeon]